MTRRISDDRAERVGKSDEGEMEELESYGSPSWLVIEIIAKDR